MRLSLQSSTSVRARRAQGAAPPSRAKFLRALAFTACLTALLFGSVGDANAGVSLGIWPKSFHTFQAQDKRNGPVKGGVLFVGSSSIRMWRLKSSFPGLPSANRGLGGSRIVHMNRFAERLVFPHDPKVIVFYSGDNDIRAGATPERVLADYQTFVRMVNARLPETHIVFISIKPSMLMVSRWAQAREANRLIESFCATDPRLHYVDVASSMLGANGKPRRELFLKDGLHLNAAGYSLWTSSVSPIIQSAMNAH